MTTATRIDRRTWKRISSEPVTTQSRTRVYHPASGQEGWASVRWDSGRVTLSGPVVDLDFVFDANGCQTEEPKVTVLDAEPKFIAVTATTYAVRRYDDGRQIGSVKLTSEQFRRYEAMTQQPEGLIRLGAMPHDLYDLDEEYQDTHGDTTIYLD
jgi:hypothetical protein